jgi:hypothetical protein
MGSDVSFEFGREIYHPCFAKDADMMQSAVALQGWTIGTSVRAAGADSEKNMANHSQIDQPIQRLARNMSIEREVRSICR